jgi:glycosyltransferase involved in cell wall biosynthesis
MTGRESFRLLFKGSTGTSTGPLVSVLICAYNAERFIEATMRSVLGQTYGQMEVLVLDNASADRTAEVLANLGEEDPRVKLFRGKRNLGAYGGLNYLLERAAGEYIAIQDHDDLWRPDKLAAQIAVLERDEAYVGCGTAIINYYERYGTFLLRRQPEVARVAWHTSLVYRNTGLRNTAKAPLANDFSFMRNLLCRGGGRIRNLGEPYVLRAVRADGSNLSTRWIRAASPLEILRLGINPVDKAALLFRRLVHQRVADSLIVRVLPRRHHLRRADVEALFPSVTRF